MDNLIQIFLLGLIIIAIFMAILIIYLLRFWHLKGLKSDEEFNEVMEIGKKNSEEFYKMKAERLGYKSNNNELFREHETLLGLINYDNYPFIKGSGINQRVKELKVMVYFDFLVDEEAELPTVVIGVKFLDGSNKILLDLLIDKYGDGCIKGNRSNRQRKNKIMIAISFAEYYLEKKFIYSNEEVKVTKVIKTALPILGLDNIEGYDLELIS